MVNKTPLRLVAVEESPPEEDEQVVAVEDLASQDGTPVRVMAEHEAVTRRVEAAATIAARETRFDEPKRQSSKWQRLLPAAAVGLVLLALVLGLSSMGKGSSAKSSLAPASTPAPPAGAFRPVLPLEKLAAPQLGNPPAAPAASPSPTKVASETIRLQITAEPVTAELSLDGNVMAGHRLNLEVPKERGIHIVSASAPGYLPFNQQVSFSSDVVLSISLRRSRAPFVARQPSRPQRSLFEPKSKGSARATAVEPGQALEPGMTLDNPRPRSNAKAIDERNPYAP
jgi:hypothetical protein